jgi:hypothetical protein
MGYSNEKFKSDFQEVYQTIRAIDGLLGALKTRQKISLTTAPFISDALKEKYRLLSDEIFNINTNSIVVLPAITTNAFIAMQENLNQTANTLIDNIIKLRDTIGGDVVRASKLLGGYQARLKTYGDRCEEILELFKEKIEFVELKAVKESIIDYRDRLEVVNKKYEDDLLSFHTAGDELVGKLEAAIADKSVGDIKTLYSTHKKDYKAEKNWNRSLFYSTAILIIVLLIGMPLAAIIFKIDIQNNWYTISSVLGITGFLGFLCNDFRKRFNIAKNILDEISQKEVVVNAYASLLEKVNTFEPEIRDKYHQEILKNIVDSLLSIRNRGYLHKSLHGAEPNLINQIVDVISNRKL